VQVAKYRAVTAADVTAFARERLGVENRATLLFVPKADDDERRATSDEREVATLAGRD